jgi:hypothetical protein
VYCIDLPAMLLAASSSVSVAKCLLKPEESSTKPKWRTYLILEDGSPLPESRSSAHCSETASFKSLGGDRMLIHMWASWKSCHVTTSLTSPWNGDSVHPSPCTMDNDVVRASIADTLSVTGMHSLLEHECDVKLFGTSTAARGFQIILTRFSLYQVRKTAGHMALHATPVSWLSSVLGQRRIATYVGKTLLYLGNCRPGIPGRRKSAESIGVRLDRF